MHWNEDYKLIAMFVAVSLVVSVIMLLLGAYLGEGKSYSDKNSPYECGFQSYGSAHIPFNVNFFAVAILFVVFDVEIVFLLPWVVYAGSLGTSAALVVCIFVGILVFGLVLEWRNGALDW